VTFSYGSGSRSAAPYHGLLDPDLDPYLDLDSDPAADPAADPGPSRCLQKATFCRHLHHSSKIKVIKKSKNSRNQGFPTTFAR